MSDPIIDITREAWSITGDDMYFDENLAKQIRQQIGRELLEKETIIESKGINNGYSINYVSSYRIREVCQLEES